MGEVILIVPRVLYSNRRLWVQLEVLVVYSLCYGSLEPRFHSLVAFVDGRIPPSICWVAPQHSTRVVVGLGGQQSVIEFPFGGHWVHLALFFHGSNY